MMKNELLKSFGYGFKHGFLGSAAFYGGLFTMIFGINYIKKGFYGWKYD